ncbi:hypothetical protein [Microbacterium sp.]|uniref:hypothetical protein n=1 Tax=Microbacterium sp. TaxID=51671 RepID=UPI002810F0A8|nr:hypothetical protein [Microbacterium sp.]
MPSKTVRQHISDELAPHLPAGWDIEPGIPTLGTLRKPLLWIEYTGFTPLPEAPLSHIAASADLCIATNKTDMRKGEDEADELVAALFEAAFAAGSFYSISAAKTVFADTYIGWRMSITVATTNPDKE